MKFFMLFFVMVGSLLPPFVTDEPVIIVNKANHEVALYRGGKQVFSAPAAIGKTQDLTPEGQFHVKVKAKNPYYRKKNIPGGDPKNPLGTRWIGFDARGTDGRIYGIHGTNQPQSIGKSVSAGCIRLNNKDAERLYELVGIDTEVVIVNANRSMKELYHEWEKGKLEGILNPAT